MKRAGSRSLVVGLDGPALEDRERSWLLEYQPGGVILFSRNITGERQLADLCHELHKLIPDLEIVVDHEGGPVSQASAAVGRPPVAWGLGVLDDLELTRRVHRETGRRLHGAGIDRVLAPVADVLTELRNPVIGCRAFGGDPELVERHVKAAVEGLLESGIRVCLKHWPGHGGTAVDTHLVPAAVGSGDLAGPFVAGLEAGADAVMVGHVFAGGDNGKLATLDASLMARAKADLATDSKPSILMFADDCSMGALRPAMSDAGIEAGDELNEGLADPALLPRAWFDRLSAAGCDRLLIRGIPYTAFPVAGSPAESERAADEGEADTAYYNDDAYREGRSRLLNLTGPWFQGEHLFWWEKSAGDRWQVAAGPGNFLEDIAEILDSRFSSVQRSGPGVNSDPEIPSRCDRLLVTSHRPLDPRDQLPCTPADRGWALTMGHPSLPGGLMKILGSGWQVVGLFDIHPLDLKE